MPIVVCANTRQSSDVKHITYHTFLQPMCLISGPPGVFVTLMGVTGQTFSPRILTAGSGPPTRLLSHSGDHSTHVVRSVSKSNEFAQKWDQ